MKGGNQCSKRKAPKQSRFRYTPGLYSDSVTETSQENSLQNETNNKNEQQHQPTSELSTQENSLQTQNEMNNNNGQQHQLTSELSAQENTLQTQSIDKNYINSVFMNFGSIETIRFSTGLSLKSLKSISWSEGISKHIEFFANKQVSVNLISIDDTLRLTQSLKDIIDGNPIAIDFEWRPDFNKYSANPISLFQIASSKGVLIVLNSAKVLNGGPYQSSEFLRICPNLSILKEFFASHKFYGKGMGNDKKKLYQLFETTFNFEDIEKSKLKPNGLKTNFDMIVNDLVGQPAAQFKNKKVSMSNWISRPLTAQQVIYAAFDAYATRLIWEALVAKYGQK